MEHEIAPTEKSSLYEKEHWDARKQKLQAKFPELTDDDLSLVEGEVEGLIERIHSKIGVAIEKTKVGLHKFIDAL